MTNDVTRRRFLAGLGAASGLALTGLPANAADALTPSTGIRQPGDRPFPHHPEGTDHLPRIDHIIIYMQENHSYDSYYGMLPRGDGYYLDRGKPQNTNPLPGGGRLKVFHAPDTCQLGPGVSQSWVNTHTEVDNGRMNGFLFNGNSNAMRYWDGTDLPFYYSLAQTFPICDRWFASAPAQTYPNRLFLQAATCQTLIATDLTQLVALPHPVGGTIWDKLDAFGISWNDYAWDLPDIALFTHTYAAHASKVKSFDQFLTDCRSGALPQVSIVSPGFNTYTEENPADIRLGEAYSSSIINAVMGSPAWPNTALFFMYDEHGGYYDHVRPPAAIPPDDIRPAVAAAPGAPDAWNSYGVRVPAFVISPYARADYVSSVVHDHTSVLRFIETKFNLGALTRRDANADNLLDCFDFRHRSFREPPTLAAPGLPATGSTCTPAIAPPPTRPKALAPAPTATAELADTPLPPLTASQVDRGALLAHWQRQGLAAAAT